MVASQTGVHPMATLEKASVLDEVVEFFITNLTPERILEFTLSDGAQRRIQDLLERNRNGRLTAEEAEELDTIGEMNDFVSLLKVRAQKKLMSQQ
jgi:hypothetical protein